MLLERSTARLACVLVNSSHEPARGDSRNQFVNAEERRPQPIPVPSPDFPVKRALIAEDDAELIPIMTAALNEVYPNFEIDWVESGEGAITKARAEQYDIIFLDIYLTGEKNGIEVWKSIEKLAPSTPVVITSGMPVDSFLKAIGSEAISPPFISKPLRVGELKQVISGLVTDVGPVS